MPSALLAILLLSPLVAGPAPEPAADLLLTGGRVWTADPSRPWAEAVAVRDGRIVFVGRDAEAARLKGPKTQAIALRGRLVTPGFEDAHLHLMSGARNLERVDLARRDDPGRAAGAHPQLRRGQPEAARGSWDGAGCTGRSPAACPRASSSTRSSPTGRPTWTATTATPAGPTARPWPSPASRRTRRTR